jgi:hypothetical protein
MKRDWILFIVIALILSVGAGCATTPPPAPTLAPPTAAPAQPTKASTAAPTAAAPTVAAPTVAAPTAAPTTVPPTVAAATKPPAATSVPQATAVTKPPAQTAPKIPVSHAGRAQCLVCHATGVSGAPKPPAVPDHSALKDDVAVCTTCHQQSK